jgi:predicted homoserine dehydrogenase-like protein
MAIGVISELKPGAARKAIEIAYGNADVWTEVATADEANAAMEAQKIALTDNVGALLEADLIDVVVDATGMPAVGVEIGLSAMERGKPFGDDVCRGRCHDRRLSARRGRTSGRDLFARHGG